VNLGQKLRAIPMLTLYYMYYAVVDGEIKLNTLLKYVVRNGKTGMEAAWITPNSRHLREIGYGCSLKLLSNEDAFPEASSSDRPLKVDSLGIKPRTLDGRSVPMSTFPW
jgi:hypothetical protein